MKKQLLLVLTVLCVSGLNADTKDYLATGTDKKEADYQGDCEYWYNEGYNDGSNDKAKNTETKTSKRSKNGNSQYSSSSRKNLGSRMENQPSKLPSGGSSNY